jgi:hypothetical protein
LGGSLHLLSARSRAIVDPTQYIATRFSAWTFNGLPKLTTSGLADGKVDLALDTVSIPRGTGRVDLRCKSALFVVRKLSGV